MTNEARAHYIANNYGPDERMHLETAILEALYQVERAALEKAAVPEMLAALKGVHRCYFLRSEYPEIAKDVDAAIAKAEGTKT